MEKRLIVGLHKNFEDCAREKDGVEFWYAREVQGLLGYGKWENFENVIKKAKIACETAKQKDFDHFAGVRKMIPMPKGASDKCKNQILKNKKHACCGRGSKF